MRTPAGKECRFYYEDFNRGRSTQECRLIGHNPNSAEWQPRDCTKCPVPDILAANGDRNMVLEGMISKGFLGFNRKVEVNAFCSKHLRDIENPYTGCTACARERPGLQDLFKDL